MVNIFAIKNIKSIKFSILAFLVFTTTLVMAKPQFSVTQSATSVWQRQHVLITLEVITDDPFSRLEIDLFQITGFNIIPFEQQRIESETDVRLIMKWAVFPFIAGKHTLQLPEVVYRSNGSRKRKLDLKTLELQVRRLPVYVSPTMPVGKISLENTWDHSWLSTPNNLLEWKIQVEGDSVAQQTMPPISRQIISTPSLQFLPIQNTHKTVFLEKGITNQQHYKIPLKALHTGKIDLPVVSVQYFEPISGKLQTTELSPPWVISVNKWLLGLIALLLLVGVVTLLVFLIKKITYYLTKTTLRKQALKQLSQANNYQQIRDALNQLSLANDWQQNLSLADFSKHWEEKFGSTLSLNKIFTELQAHQFSNKTPALTKTITQQLVKILK